MARSGCVLWVRSNDCLALWNVPASPSRPLAARHAPRLRHASAAGGVRIRTVQELLGHADVATTMNYTHLLKLGGGAVRSPIDTMSLT
jgi:integrase